MAAFVEQVPLEPRHLIQAAQAVQAALLPAAQADWSVNAGDLEWDCRSTLDHMVSAPMFYATNLAMRSRERMRGVRGPDPEASVQELLAGLECAATILAQLCEAAPADARGFHNAGMADAQGFLAMAGTEILVHGGDIAKGLGLLFSPPDEVCRLVLWRLFPWAPEDVQPWPGLLWAAGRAPLPGKDRQAPDWYWHCAPLSEWDGTIKRRAAR
jgi:hypothetical protein